MRLHQKDTVVFGIEKDMTYFAKQYGHIVVSSIESSKAPAVKFKTPEASGVHHKIIVQKHIEFVIKTRPDGTYLLSSGGEPSREAPPPRTTPTSTDKPSTESELRRPEQERSRTVARGIGTGMGLGMVLSTALGFAADKETPSTMKDRSPVVRVRKDK